MFDEFILKFRRFREIDSLDAVVPRMLGRCQDPKTEALIISAADHRRAEILAQKQFDPGKVPAYAWALI
jgi:hypothetical protein